MSDRLLELEKKAQHGEDMPTDLTLSEQLFYLAMVNLYQAYYSHQYDREQARTAKQALKATYENNAFAEKLLLHHAQLRNRYSPVLTDAEKNGCPICKRLVKIFDGREHSISN